MLSKISITASVGYNAINKPVDVALIQDLLSRAGYLVAVSGIYDETTLARIRGFQSKNGFLRPDGVVSPHGPTMAKLLKNAGKFYTGPDYWRENPSAEWWNTASRVFTCLFAQQFPNAARVVNWTIPRPTGLATVFTNICKDPHVMDLRWAAYMMATCQRECPGFVPIAEYDKGAGMPYGKPENFKATNGKTYTNTYYGRGYVQLTWGENYLKLGKAIGMGETLAEHPDDALKPDIAYKVMSYGMRKGAFTGRKLGDFIQGTTCDYYNARTIINGHDHAEGIADCAVQIEGILRLGVPPEGAPARHQLPAVIWV